LGDGFEVQQLFTEFLRWPNCICCYRYEQIIRFYDNGAVEPRFISHGPGCDDDSVYRPFWRIDLDLAGPENDEVWFWEDGRWQEGTTETSLDQFDEQSPDNHKLFTAGGGLRYYWQPIRTDPLGGDDGRLYLLQFDEEEGVGPTATGPADTFWPPGQWLNGEQVSGGNYVIWYIPILNTRWMEPWWCVPDPEPDFSPCEAILRLEPGGPLAVEPIREANETTEPAVPTATRSSEATTTPRPIAGEDGPAILLNAGCGACHALDSLGLDREIGPDLSHAAEWAGQRVDGLSAAAYLRQSILEPDAFIAPACPDGPCQPGIMPENYGRRLSPAQLNTLIAYLLDQGTAPSPIEGTSLPPSIGENEEVTRSFPGVDNQEGETTTSSIFVISFITLIIIVGLGLVHLNRKEDQEPS
jgi:cytochrome c551/c552